METEGDQFAAPVAPDRRWQIERQAERLTGYDGRADQLRSREQMLCDEIPLQGE